MRRRLFIVFVFVIFTLSTMHGVVMHGGYSYTISFRGYVSGVKKLTGIYETRAVVKMALMNVSDGGFWTINIQVFEQGGTSYPPTGVWYSPYDGYVSIHYDDGIYQVNFAVEGYVEDYYTPLDFVPAYVMLVFEGGSAHGNPARYRAVLYDKGGRKHYDKIIYMHDVGASDDHYIYLRDKYGWGFVVEYATNRTLYGVTVAVGDEDKYVVVPETGFYVDYPIENEINIESDLDWKYSTYSVGACTNVSYSIGWDNSWTVSLNETKLFDVVYNSWDGNYSEIAVETTTAYYCFNFSRAESLGDWGMFNPLRDALNTVLNAVQWIYVFVSFGLLLAANGLYYIVLLFYTVLHNTVFFWLYLAGLNLLWGIGYLLMFAFYGIVQGLTLLFGYAIPLINVVFMIITGVISFVYACLLYLVVPGADFWELYNALNEALTGLYGAVLGVVVWVLYYSPELIKIALSYAAVWVFAYIKEQYCRARGFVVRARQIENVRKALQNPVDAVYGLIKKIKDLIPFM